MSLGSRITKRGKAAIVASLASTPREPLFFLYPQWIRNSSISAIEPAFIRNGRPSTSFIRNYMTAPSNVAIDAGLDSPDETDPVENKQGEPSDQAVDDQNHGERSVAEEGASADIRNAEIRRVAAAKIKAREYAPFLRVNKSGLSKFNPGFQNRPRTILF
jgi:hypothetical protein